MGNPDIKPANSRTLPTALNKQVLGRGTLAILLVTSLNIDQTARNALSFDINGSVLGGYFDIGV